jgi:hypothetical protein
MWRSGGRHCRRTSLHPSTPSPQAALPMRAQRRPSHPPTHPPTHPRSLQQHSSQTPGTQLQEPAHCPAVSGVQSTTPRSSNTTTPRRPWHHWVPLWVEKGKEVGCGLSATARGSVPTASSVTLCHVQPVHLRNGGQQLWQQAKVIEAPRPGHRTHHTHQGT